MKYLKSLILERKQVGVLYHFSSLENIISIIENGIEFNDEKEVKELDPIMNGRYFISTTRKYNFDWEERG